VAETLASEKMAFGNIINSRIKNIIESKRNENEEVVGTLKALESSWNELNKKFDEEIKAEFDLMAVEEQAIERAKSLLQKNPCAPIEKNAFVIAGKVVDEESAVGLPGLLVRVVRKQEALPETLTDPFGNFTVKISLDILDETSVKLEKLPDNVRFPEHLKDKISYDSSKKLITFRGVMTEKEKKILQKLSVDESYREAIEILFQRTQNSGKISKEVLTFFVFSDPEKLVAKNPKELYIQPGKVEDVTIPIRCGSKLADHLEGGKSVKDGVENDAKMVSLRLENMKEAHTAIGRMAEISLKDVQTIIKDLSVPPPDLPLLRKNAPEKEPRHEQEKETTSKPDTEGTSAVSIEAKENIMPGLEDISAIGPSAAEKVKKAGIKDVKTFLETEEEKLKNILGDVNIRRIKKEINSFLKKIGKIMWKKDKE
jgi:hypothetical protein